MRVVITEPWGQRLGGAENMLLTFLRHVDRAEFEPTVVFFQAGPFVSEVADLGIRTVVLPAGRLRHVTSLWRVIRALAALLRREQPDLVLNWMGKTQLYGASAALLARMGDRVVWWQHEVPNGHWIDRLATLLPTRAVGCSSVASAQAQRRHWPRRPTFVVNPGIDSPAASSDEQIAALRRRLAIPLARQVVGLVGRLQPSKGQHRLLEAVGELRRRGHDVHALIVGGDAYQLSPRYDRWLRRRAVRLGLDEAVTFTGQVTNAAPYIQMMDVLVNASPREPFGIVLLEGMALGTPVVAFHSAGPAEIIEDGKSGLCIPSGGPGRLADTLEQLIRSPNLRETLAQGGRQRFLSTFTARQMAVKLQQSLEVLRYGQVRSVVA